MTLLRFANFPILFIIPALLAVNTTYASGSGKSRGKQKISAMVKLSEQNIHAGSTLLAMLIVNIDDGWHINSVSPADENLVGTLVETGKTKAVDSIEIRYPLPVEVKLEISDKPLQMYEGTIHILLRLKLATGIKSGMYSLPATIHYQACSNTICQMPQSLDVNIPLRVVSSQKKSLKINQELFEGYTGTP